jgi:hypothetical protein
MLLHPSAPPCFRIIRRSGHCVLGHVRWVFDLQLMFLCSKNNLKYILLAMRPLPYRDKWSNTTPVSLNLPPSVNSMGGGGGGR